MITTAQILDILTRTTRGQLPPAIAAGVGLPVEVVRRTMTAAGYPDLADVRTEVERIRVKDAGELDEPADVLDWSGILSRGLARASTRTRALRAIRLLRSIQADTDTADERAAVRAWARAQGMPIAEHGRIPARVMTAYDERED